MQIDHPGLTTNASRRALGVLTDAGYRALFVGGTVRNAILRMPVTDFDVATDAAPETVMALAKAAEVRAVPTGIDHGTVTLVSDGVPFEITTFRKDIETDGRRAVVHFSDSLEDDARRRDFTMNALYAGADGTLIDPLGGLEDALAGRVRFIGEPEDRIREDYLRILRFFRFTAWYTSPFEGLDAEGLAACAALAEGLDRLSKERIGAEIKKLLSAPDCAIATAAMERGGILARVLPGASSALIGPLQELESRAEASPEAIRRLAALGAFDVQETLRLSKTEARDYNRLRTAMSSTTEAAALGFELGQERGMDALLLRGAALGQAVSEADAKAMQSGANAEFPVRAIDLPEYLKGPALGAELKRLQALWLASGCRLSKADLLGL
jgi:poly(A) polymerase